MVIRTTVIEADSLGWNGLTQLKPFGACWMIPDIVGVLPAERNIPYYDISIAACWALQVNMDESGEVVKVVVTGLMHRDQQRSVLYICISHSARLEADQPARIFEHLNLTGTPVDGVLPFVPMIEANASPRLKD